MPEANVVPVTILTPDGFALEGERSTPVGPIRAGPIRAGPIRGGVVLCHPHPQYGGTMRSLVVSALFDALPRAGIDCVRFNYRGVERSAGTYDEGRGERLDVLAALDALASGLPTGVPIVMVGWSFGADLALATHDPRIAGWVGIALPMRFVSDDDVAAVATDPRPKLVVLAQHDEFRDPAWVREHTAAWTATSWEEVPGASHFFVGRTERVIELVSGFVAARV